MIHFEALNYMPYRSPHNSNNQQYLNAPVSRDQPTGADRLWAIRTTGSHNSTLRYTGFYICWVRFSTIHNNLLATLIEEWRYPCCHFAMYSIETQFASKFGNKLQWILCWYDIFLEHVEIKSHCAGFLHTTAGEKWRILVLTHNRGPFGLLWWFNRLK